MHVAGLQAQPVHGRKMPDRIARMAVHDELRARRRARGEIEEHRIVGAGRPVGLKARDWGSSASRTRASRLPRRRPRSSRPARRPRRTSRRPGHAATRNFALPRSSRSAMSASPSCGIAGMRTRPSFIAASIVTHSSGAAPSIISSRSPRLAPMRAQAVGDARGFLRQFGEGARLDRLADHLQRGLRAVVARREFGVEPVERPVETLRPRPDEGGLGGDVAVVELEQEIARLSESRRLGDGGGGREHGGHGRIGISRAAPAIAQVCGAVDAKARRISSLRSLRGGVYPRRFFGA